MSDDTARKIHHFGSEANGIEPPLRFNDPFDYVPHPLCTIAAERVRRYVSEHAVLRNDAAAGKMFGVLVVRRDEELGFLAAFSGNLAGTNNHEYFVPPVYDMLRPDDFFRREERAVSQINIRISEIENAPQRLDALQRLAETERTATVEIEAYKEIMRLSKIRRDELRRTTNDTAETEALLDESRFQKAELHRLKLRWRRITEEARACVERFETETETLKSERRRRSEALQMKLFERFEMLDADGCKRNLCDIFAPTAQGTPPAGAGECSAPKLLQYAYLNGLMPVTMAEFWYGASPKSELRRDGCYYPACTGKCKPILEHMLRGLDVERHTAARAAGARTAARAEEPKIVYEDDFTVVIDKPAGMLSVAGKITAPSAEEWARKRFPNAPHVAAVHRLDMDTSGLLLIAKDLDTYRHLQRQFYERTVCKRYLALLEGTVSTDCGRIELPLRADILDRPRQKVDTEHSKSAVTEFRVLERRNGTTLVEFRPLTGRTHQLRVHAAHPQGLNAPIVGDTLYGKPASRLCLHAEYIEFTHPQTGERMRFEQPADFR